MERSLLKGGIGESLSVGDIFGDSRKKGVREVRIIMLKSLKQNIHFQLILYGGKIMPIFNHTEGGDHGDEY